jgi:hypothetical protein
LISNSKNAISFSSAPQQALDAGFLKQFTTAFWARRGEIGRNRSRKMFNVTTSVAFSRQQSLFLALVVEQLQRLFGSSRILSKICRSVSDVSAIS